MRLFAFFCQFWYLVFILQISSVHVSFVLIQVTNAVLAFASVPRYIQAQIMCYFNINPFEFSGKETHHIFQVDNISSANRDKLVFSLVVQGALRRLWV